MGMEEGGILIGPRGAGEQAEEQEERKLSFLLDLQRHNLEIKYCCLPQYILLIHANF